MVDVPVTSDTVGLKSTAFFNSNTPDGSGSSGSILVATYDGMSAYFICPETEE